MTPETQAVSGGFFRRKVKLLPYRSHALIEARVRKLVLLVSGIGAAILGSIAAILWLDITIPGIPGILWLDFLAFAILAGIGPYGFYYQKSLKRIRSLEERFPDFLRDIAVSRKAGLTLVASVNVAVRGDYGALSPEVRRMADELSWNATFNESLRHFGERVGTPLIRRAVTLVDEASRMGGNITDVLMATARDAREIKTLETERRLTMGLYTAVIYVAFFVFLGVAATLYGTFIPELLKATTATEGASTAAVAGLNLGSTLSIQDYRAFYFLAAIVQALGNGLVAGVIETGKAPSGLRHSFILVLITYVTFTFLI